MLSTGACRREEKEPFMFSISIRLPLRSIMKLLFIGQRLVGALQLSNVGEEVSPCARPTKICPGAKRGRGGITQLSATAKPGTAPLRIGCYPGNMLLFRTHQPGHVGGSASSIGNPRTAGVPDSRTPRAGS